MAAIAPTLTARRAPARAATPLPLDAPETLRARFPLDRRAEATVRAGRAALRDALHGADDRLVVIAGPCSIHDPEAALEYAARLRRAADALGDALVLVMRTFVEKPRTSVGWKGFANDPDLDGRCDVGRGLALSRALLRDVNALGVPCAAEILDPLTPAYLGDLFSWGGVGARTSESQVHRQLASGLPFPIGFKNGTSGDLGAAGHALHAASRPHRFVGIGADGRCAVIATEGNPDGHIVLRGGASRPNYAEAEVAEAARRAATAAARPVLVDCSHGNSAYDPRRQGDVCRAVLAQRRGGSRVLLGLMLESHLEEGRQDAGRLPLRRGVSITDACIGWEETQELLEAAAEAVRATR